MAKKKRSHDADAFAGSAVGASTTSVNAVANATDAVREGMARVVEEAGKNTPDKWLKGNLFEYIEAARFNRQAALQGSPVTARVTAQDGRPGAPADIEFISKSGKVLKEAQLKASKGTSYPTHDLAKTKYENMGRVVPSDMADATQQHTEKLAQKLERKGDPRAAQYQESLDNMEGKLRYRKISSGGTTTEDLDSAAKSPKRFAAMEVGGALVGEAHEAGKQAAVASALIAGGLSICRNTFAVSKGELEGKQAAANIATDVGKSAIRGYSTGAGGAFARNVLPKTASTGARALGVRAAKANVPVAVAASVVETGVIVLDYANGKISAGEAAERIGITGCSTLASIYTGAAAGAVFGPPGAVVGSIAGYLVTMSVYQSCIAIMNNARLAEEEAARLVALCEQAVRSLDQQRESFEIALNEHLNDRQARFDGFFKEIDEALDADRTEDAILALSGLVASCGRELRLGNFEEFDSFMLKSDQPLTI